LLDTPNDVKPILEIGCLRRTMENPNLENMVPLSAVFYALKPESKDLNLYARYSLKSTKWQ